MVQIVPNAPGTFPYPDAGNNPYEGIGSILAALAGSLDLYRQRKDARRTLGDVAGAPPSQENPAYFNQGQNPTYRSLSSPLAGLMGRSPATSGASRGAGNNMSAAGFGAPTPMAIPGNQNSLQALVYGNGLQSMRLSDLPHLAGLKALMAPDPNTLLYHLYRNQQLKQKIDMAPEELQIKKGNASSRSQGVGQKSEELSIRRKDAATRAKNAETYNWSAHNKPQKKNPLGLQGY